MILFVTQKQTNKQTHPMEHPHNTMRNASRIMRTSIFTFLQSYPFFSSTPFFLLFPFVLSTLLSSSFVSSSHLLPLVRFCLHSLFLAMGLPPSSELFVVLNLKLSQTILTSLFVVPFALSSLLFAKCSIIIALGNRTGTSPIQKKHAPLFPTFASLLVTHLYNSLLIILANAACIVVLVVSFNIADILGLSSPKARLILSAIGAIFYSIVLANAYVISSLSLIVSGLERRGGFGSILKACDAMQGRTATVLSLAVPINMAMAGVDALFRYRVVSSYRGAAGLGLYPVALEAMVVAYMYGVLIIIDTISGYVFLQRWSSSYCRAQEEDTHSHAIEIKERLYEKSFLDLD